MLMSTSSRSAGRRVTVFPQRFRWRSKHSSVLKDLVGSNRQAVKATLAESEQPWQMAMSGKDPAELWVHQANAARPVAERALSGAS